LTLRIQQLTNDVIGLKLKGRDLIDGHTGITLIVLMGDTDTNSSQDRIIVEQINSTERS
jgi:hypothetical protein